ncbi:MAG TPA: hypothetical protein VM935_15145 [Chitinophagaceae bacterium]|nr:hypothetical protein [Chitinophagaceae bacterium]
MKFLVYALSMIFTLPSFAQDISGIYTGTLTNDSLKMTQNYQLALSEYKGKITGYSYITFVSNDTFYYGIKRIRATREKSELIVEDVEMLVNNYPQKPDKGVHVINTLQLPGEDSIVSLNGTWKTTKTKKFYSIGGPMSLKKDSDSAGSALISHLKELDIVKGFQPEMQKVTKAPSQQKTKVSKEANEVVAPVKISEALTIANNATPPENRKIKTLESVTISSDSLVLSFYDNGVVDGDTISVYLNDQIILSKAKLKEVAAKKTVFTNLDGVEEYKLTLIAENLGSIPPNTGLLVIQDGSQKYQIRFSADMQNNASIIIRKQKKLQ